MKEMNKQEEVEYRYILKWQLQPLLLLLLCCVAAIILMLIILSRFLWIISSFMLG